jgi:hypothetical protein
VTVQRRNPSGKKSEQGILQFVNRNQAARGCDEVGSAPLAFFDAANLRGGHLVAWSDSCAD